MRAAVRTGARALHVYVDKRLILSWDDAERVEFVTNIHNHEIRNQIADVLGQDPIVGLAGLGAAPLRKARWSWSTLCTGCPTSAGYTTFTTI
jgi:hypothetical protein